MNPLSGGTRYEKAMAELNSELARERSAHQAIVEQVVAWNHSAFTACEGVRNSHSPIEELLAQHEERGAELDEERSARIAAEEARDKWKGCYQTQEIYLAKIEGILTEAEAENKRLSQALAYERDEYGQYREAMERGKL